MDANRMAMLDLARPDGMGDFKALAQGKGLAEDLRLAGFATSDETKERQGISRPFLSYPKTTWS